MRDQSIAGCDVADRLPLTAVQAGAEHVRVLASAGGK
jgi:hypothetical protein